MIANSPFAAHYPGGFIGQRFADALRRRLIDEKIARVFFGVGVPGHDLDTFRPSFSQHGRDAFLVLDADGDDIDAAGDPGLDDLVLLCRIEIGRAVPQQLGAEFLRGLFSTLFGS